MNIEQKTLGQILWEEYSNENPDFSKDFWFKLDSKQRKVFEDIAEPLKQAVLKENTNFILYAEILNLREQLSRVNALIEQIHDTLLMLKRRIAFIGWPKEQMWRPEQNKNILIPDWRKEIQAIEDAQNAYEKHIK